MKIDNSAKTIATLAGNTGPRNAGAPAAGSAAKAASSDSAQTVLSAAGLQAAAATEGAFDAKKVAEIRQAISEGRFKIDAERIADGLVASVKEMLIQQQVSRSR